MRKLSGTDASFLYSETPNTPQHVGSIQYVEVVEEKRASYFEDLRALYLARIHLVPYLTNRLVNMPWGIDHPVWVRDRSFDIDNHFTRLTLPTPGSQEMLEELCAELYEPVLDRTSPLWHVWVIDGLADGRVAVFSKIHHACIDGIASIAAIETLSDYGPAPRALEPAPEDFWEVRDPTLADLYRESWFNLARYSIDSWSSWPELLTASSRSSENGIRAAAERPTSARKAPWNSPVDSKRGLAGTAFSLTTLKAISRKTRTKINDVILAITADALERYLKRLGVDVDGPMIAGCPVSLREPGDATLNNQVTMMPVSIENHIDDPLLRLESIGRHAKAAKADLAELGDAIRTDFGAPFLPAQLEALSRATASGGFAAFSEEVPINLVVSNVPGFSQPIYLAGAKVVGSTPCSIVSHGAGLNVTVSSYLDRMDVGLTASSKVVPDIHALREDFDGAYCALVEAVLEPQAEFEPMVEEFRVAAG